MAVHQTRQATMRLMLKTDLSASSKVEFAIVDLTPQFVALVAARKRLLDFLLENDENTSSIFFADENVHFVAMEPEDSNLTFKELKDLANGEILDVRPEFDDSKLARHAPFECEMIVRESGIGWVTSLKDSNEQLATVEIPFEYILEADVGEPPRRLHLVTPEEFEEASKAEEAAQAETPPTEEKKGFLAFLSSLKPTTGEC